MAGLSGLTSQSLEPTKTFNWTWFIELITCGILVIWFLFYLNRLFATLISYGIRAYTWHKFRVYIDIKSIQISFLGGRIFFKGIRYHGENETVYIHNGHIGWRYWLRATRQINLSEDNIKKGGSRLSTEKTKEDAEEDINLDSEADSEEKDSKKKQDQPESRIIISITGLEWFIYNRTPVYDAIVQDSGLKASSDAAEPRHSVSIGLKVLGDALKETLAKKADSDETSSNIEEHAEIKQSTTKPSFSSDPRGTSDASDRQSLASEVSSAETEVSAFYSILLRFFPVGIDCSKGAISIGNEQTRAIIVTTFDKARGHIDAAASGPVDIYRQVFDFDIEHPVVQMKPNPDFRLPQIPAAERIILGSEAVLKRTPWWRVDFNISRRRRALTSGLRTLLPRFRRSVENVHNDKSHHTKDTTPYSVFAGTQLDNPSWHGLDRYMDDDEGDDHHTWAQIEYARFSTLFESDHVKLQFYWDTPSTVRAEHVATSNSGLTADLNGVEPPAYGLHLDIGASWVNYGPWADRLRAEIQNVFLPAGYKTATPKPPLSEGDTRLSSVMDITICIKKEVTLRVPTRETSKDWRWRGRATAVKDAAVFKKQQERRHFRFRRNAKRKLGPDVRPFGWIAVSVGARSTVRYTMDMYPGFDGYRNTLKMNLKSTEATSSVNHSTLWRCQEQQVDANLSNPLGWNEQHTWRFDIINKGMDLFLLRDHTFLLLDLISDFTAGLKSDYMTFMPFRYIIGLDFQDFKLFLNANDNNIIDNPSDLDENAFLVLGFGTLSGEVDIPMRYFSPAQTSVGFKGNGENVYMSLKTPSWNTLSTFSQDENTASLKSLSLDGSYNYFSSTKPGLTESLVMNISGISPLFILQGYLIRFFMNVKDNYFGDTIHFSTLEEYQAKLDGAQPFSDDEKKAPPKKSNELDVILSVRAEKATALMPANIYRRDETLRIDVLLIEADMRFTNYYMDLQVSSSPVEASTQKQVPRDDESKPEATGSQLFIDGMTVYGHRLFGAPPTEPTYLCNWDFDVGQILGECTTDFLRIMIASILSFIYTMDDDENALPKSEMPVIPDVTFLRMRAAGIRTWIVCAETAFLLDIAPTTVELNDWANKHFSKYVKVHVPLILVAAVNGKSAYRQRESSDKTVPTLCCFQTSVKLAILDRKSDFAHNRAMQQQHIRFHDSRTNRAQWLLHKQHGTTPALHTGAWSRLPPGMPVPMMPEPISCSSSGPQRANNSTKRSFLANDDLISRSAYEPCSTLSQQGLRAFDANQHNYRPLSGVGRSTTNAAQTIVDENPLSSPWVKPHFTLQDIRPDFTNMPNIPKFANAHDAAVHTESIEDEDFSTLDDDLKHDGVFCNLADGIRGFSTPELVAAVVTLLNELSPKRPESILDDLQMQVISSIKKLADKHIGVVNDLAFRLPFGCIRLLNYRDVSNPDDGHDQYDLSLQDARATVRLAPAAEPKSLRLDNLVYINVESLNVEIAEHIPQSEQFTSGAEVTLSEISLWLSLKTERRVRTQVSNIDVITAGKNIDSLAGLIDRSQSVVFDAVHELEKLELSDKTQHLLYHLTTCDDVLDPPFLSRPSYVLRTVDEHVRMHDSWKMIMRLRNIWKTYAGSASSRMKCSDTCPHEDKQLARSHVLASFDQWKIWENPDQDDNLLLQAVYGSDHHQTETSNEHFDTEAEVLLGRLALTLDPGPQQSQAVINSLDLNVSEKMNKEKRARWSFHGESKKNQTVQAYCGAFGIHLHWELIGLAERLITLSEEYKKRQPAEEALVPTKTILQSNATDLSVVIGADAAAIELASPNAHLLVGVESFRSSLATTLHSQARKAHSIILNAASGRVRLRALNKKILGCKVSTPTIYLNTQETVSNFQTMHIIHAAATCEKLRFHIKEDILGLMQVVETVLANEVATVQRLADKLPGRSKHSAGSSSSPAQQLPMVRPHIALFLSDYHLQFDIMPYLQYMITGQIARTSVIPHSHRKFSIQLDIKENQHFFDTPNTNARKSRSALSTPPVVLAFTVNILPTRLVVDASATVEPMSFEASAVRSCFDAAYQPSTIQYIESVKQAVGQLQRTIQSVFPPTDPATKVQQEERKTVFSQYEVQYSIQAIISGVRLHCSAPAIRVDQDYRADLDISIDVTTLVMHNNLPEGQGLSQKPHFEFTMKEILVILARVYGSKEEFGEFKAGLHISGSPELDESKREVQNFHLITQGIKLDLYAETAVLVVDFVTFLQDRINSLAAAEDAKKLRPLRRLTMATINPPPIHDLEEGVQHDEEGPMGLLDSTFSVDINAICLRWLLSRQVVEIVHQQSENMVFSIQKIDLKTRRDASARLAISGLQLQLVPLSTTDPFERTANSALLPEMIFNAAYGRSPATRKFAFKAAGKLVDVRLASNFVIPASAVQRSLALASSEVRSLKTSSTTSSNQPTQAQLPKILGTKRLSSLLVFADFAGAKVTVSPVKAQNPTSAFDMLKGPKRSKAGRYGQAVQSFTGEEATLRAPGIAFQVEYYDDGEDDPTLSTEVRVAASSNTLAPSVVPLILEISSSVSNLLGRDNDTANQADEKAESQPDSEAADGRTLQQVTDPTAILGRVKLNAGLWVQKQEFSLTCQPIARVAATAKFDEIFVVVNTVQAKDEERFFSVTNTFSNLAVSVQHVYSRESTASFTVESIVVSLMNSKHFSGKSGISVILNVSPMKADLNAKQMQDFLLFREIWYPPEMRATEKSPPPPTPEEVNQTAMIQKFQEVTSTAVLPWHAVVSIQELKLQVDFGQSIGKSDFAITKLWASSKKNSDSEQNLCIGFERIGIDSSGRMSGFVELQGFSVRTAIRWPLVGNEVQAPLVQGSIGFDHLRAKTAFDYQPFGVADISSFNFLIYNVRQEKGSDRLVGILDGGKIQAFVTTVAAAQVLSIYQAFERLIQEKQEAFESSLHELDRYLRRKSIFPSDVWKAPVDENEVKASRKMLHHQHAPRLQVDVVITLQAIDAGVFMSSFFDETTVKLEASDVQARFAVGETNYKTHSGLGMSLGQVRLALAAMSRPNAKALGEMSVTEVIDRATTAKGGTILKVPRLVASMETWQQADSKVIEYIFRSIFQGKVDVGWNYSRISQIRRMWENHSRALAQKMDKPLPPSAIKITAEPKSGIPGAGGKEKITAVVNMPQSKYEYIALEPPIIDTPQLRDLGEATPSLEWIGLHRDRLPHVTHSVIIVSLLEVAKEVEDTYSRILGAS